MARTLVADNNHLCSYWISALGVASAQTILWPRGINRLLISSPAAAIFPFQWRADGVAPTFPSDGGLPFGTAEYGAGVRLAGGNLAAAIIEVERASSVWTIRNLSTLASAFYIEGHVIGGAE